MDTKEEIASNVLDIINNGALTAYVAGGYARDKHYGLEPRDIDIWVIEPFNRDDILSIAAQIQTLYGDKHEIKAFDRHESVLPERNDPAMHYVIKIGKFVDVIFLSGVTDTRGIVNRFDTNINQFVMFPITVEPVNILYYSPVFMGKNLRVLTQIRDEVAPYRLLKSINKVREINAIIEDTGLHPAFYRRIEIPLSMRLGKDIIHSLSQEEIDDYVAVTQA